MTNGDFHITDEERAYMKRAATAEERAATKGMPAFVADGWITRQRAHHLAKKRDDARTERIKNALIAYAEALQ